MTKAEACKQLGYKSYDTALPQGWFDMMRIKLKDRFPSNYHPWSHFVWVYEDNDGSYLGGKPGAISDIGRQML